MSINTEKLYKDMVNKPSDINEHLPTLYEYARSCSSVLELGVRSAVSSVAFVKGLKDSNCKGDKVLISNDLNSNENINIIRKLCEMENVKYTFIKKNDLQIDVPEEVGETDITFIDTWHIYGQLKRELEKFSPVTKKYIILHDTEIDAVFGETLRCGWDATIQSKESGFPIEQITKGLRPAIEEFLVANTNWTVHKHFINNNGLTVLIRMD